MQPKPPRSPVSKLKVATTHSTLNPSIVSEQIKKNYMYMKDEQQSMVNSEGITATELIIGILTIFVCSIGIVTCSWMYRKPTVLDAQTNGNRDRDG